MDGDAVMVAICLASAVATFPNGRISPNYPIALSPGMEHNVFFVFTVVITLGYTWNHALGATFISGILFLLLSQIGLRERLIQDLPGNLKSAIALVGLEWSGLAILVGICLTLLVGLLCGLVSYQGLWWVRCLRCRIRFLN